MKNQTQRFWWRKENLLETDLKVKPLRGIKTQEITIKRLSKDYKHWEHLQTNVRPWLCKIDKPPTRLLAHNLLQCDSPLPDPSDRLLNYTQYQISKDHLRRTTRLTIILFKHNLSQTLLGENSYLSISIEMYL